MCSDSDLPQRGKQHVTGDTAVNAFKFHAPQEWVYSEPEQNNDYGWDFLVTVTKDGDVTDDFHVQVKGSNSPSYSSDGTFISVTLKVSTTKWLQRKPVPVMIAFCDTG